MKSYLKIGIFVVFCLFQSTILVSQDQPDTNRMVNLNDTIPMETEKIDSHSVRKATIYSSVLPGLGQAYNKKWWKIPLIYGALGSLGYFAVRNHIQHRTHVDEYNKRVDDPSYVSPIEFQNLDNQALITVHRQYQDNRDLMILGFIAVYAINIIDATVDAHFYHFDISDDLSMRINPRIQPLNIQQYYSGLQFTFSFKSPTIRNRKSSVFNPLKF